MEKLSRDWLDVNKLVLYGWGNVGKKCYKKFREDFSIVSIVDNDSCKQGNMDGIPIVGIDVALEIIRENKVVVLTGGKVYRDIAVTLTEKGLKEYIDFCPVEVFISEWYWNKRNENCLLEVHSAVTMRCTFNCKNCNMFVPYYREKIDYSFDELKRMYDLFFRYVDYVFCIALLGGEPLISSVTRELIDYLGKTYCDKIGVMNIISNGSVVPDDETLEVLAKNRVLVYLSDYSATIPYKEKLAQVEKVLASRGIRCQRRESKEWKDFGFPITKPDIQEDLALHMNTCAPLFHGLNDDKFYYCHVAWSAEKAGLYRLQKKDYVDLKELEEKDKRILVTHAMGDMEDHYVSLCKVCGGCGEDNRKNVRAAVQLE